ncbi:hypothetical protein MXB_2438 [Myxobolus squamalis]|nr:hypothetical protein MXB_2438 [Myxobolus squamalis]
MLCKNQVIESYLYHGKIIKKEKDVPDTNGDGLGNYRSDVLGQVRQQIECAVGCPKSCAPACKPSCCFPQLFQPNPQILPEIKQISPGHSAAGKCSPTCALFWTQNILDSLNGVFQSVPCPASCIESSCCQPTSDYSSLASGCSSQCAPTYQPSCCHLNKKMNDILTNVNHPITQAPKPRDEQPPIKYFPCSAFCAPNFTAECCAKSTVLAPIRI